MAAQSMRINEESGARCVVCGGEQWIFVREGRDLYRPESAKVFKLMKCQGCGQIAQCPAPSEDQLGEAYSAEYAPYCPAWKETGWPMWKIFRTITTWRRIQRLKRYARTGNLLEVGAGAGDFLRAAHRAGWEVKAVEYSINMAEAIHQELGFDVRSGELRSGLWTEGQFDVVAFWSVLEHLRDPVGSLSIAASYLKQGGAIFIQIPTLNGAELGMWFGEYWALLEFPRHLNFLDSHALESLCDKAGLDLILFKTTLLDMAWCYVTSSLNFANQYKRPLQRLPRLAALLAIVLLSLPWLAVQAWRGRGTEALAMAIKR